MEVFIILFVILMLLNVAISGRRLSSSSRLIVTIFCTLLLVCIQGFRHEIVGVDSFNAYRPFFESVNAGLSNLSDFSDVLFGFEPGFVFFTKITKTLCDDTQVYIFICSALSIIPISYLIYKYAENIPLAFIIFSSFILYHFGFSGIRQAIAIGITTIAFRYIHHKNFIKFVILVLLASSIHSSAILFIIAYPLYHKLRLTPQTTFLFTVCFIISLFFVKPVVLELTEIIFGGDKYMSKVMEDAVPSYNLMILFACFLFFTYLSDDKRIQPIRSLLLIMLVFQSLGLVSESASRMAYYFIPYLSIALPITIRSMKMHSVVSFIMAILFILFFFYNNGNGYLDVIPYRFFWE